MVRPRCLTLVGGRGGGLVGRAPWPVGGRCCMVAVLVIRVSCEGGLDYGLSLVKALRFTRMPGDGRAEGGEDLAQEGCMCCLCFLLRVDGG